MVDVKDFIAQSLLEIRSGIETARQDVLFGQDIAPPLDSKATIDPAYKVAWHDGMFWTTVHFDIAVTVKSSTEGGGKAGFKIPVVELGMTLGAEHQRASEDVSRLQFTVPLRISRKTN